MRRIQQKPTQAALGRQRWGGSVVFLEADLFAADGRMLARASSTGKLLRPR